MVKGDWRFWMMLDWFLDVSVFIVAVMKVSRHVVAQRRAELGEWIKRRRFISLRDVCERFGISEATARRDLRALESDKTIVRAFGGAVGDFDQTFEPFSQRMEHAADDKQTLVETAVEFVASGMTCFLDGGTTLFYLARELSRREFRSLCVVTNNLAAAEALAQTKGVKLVLTGGQFLGRQSILLGREALHGIKPYHFDLAFLSAQGINRQGLWNSRGNVVGIQKAVMKASSRSIFCLDRTKFGKKGEEFLMRLDELPQCITNARPADFKRARFAQNPEQFILST